MISARFTYALGEVYLWRRALLGRSPLERFTYDLGEVYL